MRLKPCGALTGVIEHRLAGVETGGVPTAISHGCDQAPASACGLEDGGASGPGVAVALPESFEKGDLARRVGIKDEVVVERGIIPIRLLPAHRRRLGQGGGEREGRQGKVGSDGASPPREDGGRTSV